jgi:ubiquinone/menaquinone biosynthesis C-methylase UbiE
MTETDKVFAGSIPAIYDGLLVPMIFTYYARDLAARVAQSNPSHVLETAAGTGALTRELAARLPANAALTATDLNQPMLDHNASMLRHDARISWRQADALALPFEDGKFDAVTCQFGVMFFPDRVRGYAEARRVLRSGGCFIFNVWDRIEENDFALVVTEAVASVFPADPPRFMARTPHGYADVERIRDDLSAAGFGSIGIETRATTSKAASPRDVAVAICQGTPLRNEIETRDPARLEEATQAAADAVARRFGTGAVEGRISAHAVTAVR